MDKTPDSQILVGPVGAPTGLRYATDFISPEHEAELLCQLQKLDWDGQGLFRRRGRVVKRRELHFLHNYARDSRNLEAGAPLPPFLEGVRTQCANATGGERELFQQVIAAFYRPGAAIDWHVDAIEAFGNLICGISLGADSVMQFRALGNNNAWSLTLHQRSLLVLEGPARFEFEHRIAPVKAPRYSITLRTLR